MNMNMKIGGDYYCRNCDSRHNSGIRCGPASPLQVVQMAIEGVEEFAQDIQLKMESRRNLNGLLTKLREILSVPQEPIFADSYTAIDLEDRLLNARIFKPKMVKFMGKMVKQNPIITAQGKKELLREKKEKEKSLRYNPTPKQIAEAKKIFRNINNCIEQNGLMTESQVKDYKEKIADLKERLKL